MYTPAVRELCYSFLPDQIPPAKVATTIQAVLKCFMPSFDVHTTELPSEGCACYMRRQELTTISMVHKATKITQEAQSGTLHLNSECCPGLPSTVSDSLRIPQIMGTSYVFPMYIPKSQQASMVHSTDSQTIHVHSCILRTSLHGYSEKSQVLIILDIPGIPSQTGMMRHPKFPESRISQYIPIDFPGHPWDSQAEWQGERSQVFGVPDIPGHTWDSQAK